MNKFKRNILTKCTLSRKSAILEELYYKFKEKSNLARVDFFCQKQQSQYLKLCNLNIFIFRLNLQKIHFLPFAQKNETFLFKITLRSVKILIVNFSETILQTNLMLEFSIYIETMSFLRKCHEKNAPYLCKAPKK